MQRGAGTLEQLARTHRQALHISSRLSSHFRENRQPLAIDVKPERVVQVLHNAGIKSVLMGTHALNTWRDEPRATQDVDVLVRKKDVARAVKAFTTAFPDLVLQDTSVVMRFIDPATQKVVIDLLKPSQGVLKIVFRHTLQVGKTYCIPDLEMALVAKFAAMVSPNRRLDKKMLDAGDLANVVMFNRSKIDLDKLRRLADKVYQGGGQEILQIIDDIDAGRTIKL